jgi:exonuclease SbcC
MIAERAGQSFSLLILDEVFGSLDEARRFNVVELLRGIQDRFEQVILITHIEPVREGLDRVISVSYDPDRGCSVVEQTTPESADEEELVMAFAAPEPQSRRSPRPDTGDGDAARASAGTSP